MSDYAKKREMERSYKYYLKVVNGIPDFINRKLAQMPNNKGYIWRGVFCFGNLPAERGQPTVMFEKFKDTLVIHEWTESQYKLFHKVGKNRKTLMHVSKRFNKVSNAVSIMDYCRQ